MDSTHRIKAKILFFVPLPPPIGGAALRNKSLVESSILNQAFDIEVIPFNFADKVNDIGKLSIKKIFKFFERAYVIVYKIITYRPHLVYFNLSLYGYALYRDFIFVLLFKMFGCHLLFHLRTQGVKTQIQQSAIKRFMFKFIFKNTRVICLSQFLSLDIIDVYHGHPIVVNNGIEDVSQRFLPKQRKKNETVRILFMAHLWFAKGVIELVDALSILKLETLKFHVTIAGPEGDITIPYLEEKISRLGLSNDVDVVGSMSGDEKYQLFRDADIFVLPTRFEAFPGVILEAMQFGLPVVATLEGAIPEIVDDDLTGLLVQKQDASDLAAKLRRTITQADLRKRFGENGRRKFVNNYVLEIFENNMKNAFNNVLSEIYPK